MDSDVLAEMVDLVRLRSLPLHSVVVARHGRVVLDAAIYPFETGRMHDIASATKSVTSILIRIAIDKGYIKSGQQRVVEILPEALPATVGHGSFPKIAIVRNIQRPPDLLAAR